MAGYGGTFLGATFPVTSFPGLPEKGDWQIIRNPETHQLEYQRWNGVQWVTKVNHGASVTSDTFIVNTSAGGVVIDELEQERRFLVLPKMGGNGTVVNGKGHLEMCYSESFNLFKLDETPVDFILPTDGSTVSVPANGSYTYQGISPLNEYFYVLSNLLKSKNGTSTYNSRFVLKDDQDRVIMESQSEEEYDADVTPQPIGVDSEVLYVFQTQRPYSARVITTVEMYSKEDLDLEGSTDLDEVVRITGTVAVLPVQRETILHRPVYDSNTSYNGGLSKIADLDTFLTPIFASAEVGLFTMNQWQSCDCPTRWAGTDFTVLDVTASTVISFTNLTGRTIINHHGSCTQPTVSGDTVIFSDSGDLEAFQFDNFEWIVTCAGTGTVANSIDPRLDTFGSLGDGVISNGTWGTGGELGYLWNYGGAVVSGANIPATIDRTRLVNGDPVTNIAIYGDNEIDGTIDAYQNAYGMYKHTGASHSLSNGVEHILSPNVKTEEFPLKQDFFDISTTKIQLPNTIKYVYKVSLQLIITASATNKILDFEIRLAGGAETVLAAKSVPILKLTATYFEEFTIVASEDIETYGLYAAIMPDTSGTLTYEELKIYELGK